jgi:ribosomal protein L16 Arg81 hydroxylase
MGFHGETASWVGTQQALALRRERMKAFVQYEPIDRRGGLSVREFKREYFRRNRPVVLSDAIDGWQARSSWTFDYFKSEYGKSMIAAYRYGEEGRYQEELVERMPLADYIDKILANDFDAYPFYMRDSAKFLLDHSELFAAFTFPKHCFDWFRLVPGSLRRPGTRIFIGPKGAVTNLHQDIWGTHFWMAQLVGRKRWVLFSPDQKEFLFKHCWQVRPDEPDLDRFPLFPKAKGFECTIGPGDLIIVPSNWVHWVVSLDPTISLTHNYMGPGNFRPCLKGQLSWTRDAAISALKARVSREGRGAPVRDLQRQKG